MAPGRRARRPCSAPTTTWNIQVVDDSLDAPCSARPLARSWTPTSTRTNTPLDMELIYGRASFSRTSSRLATV